LYDHDEHDELYEEQQEASVEHLDDDESTADGRLNEVGATFVGSFRLEATLTLLLSSLLAKDSSVSWALNERDLSVDGAGGSVNTAGVAITR